MGVQITTIQISSMISAQVVDATSTSPYFIIQFIFFPSTPNRLLAKQICIAPGGCKIEMDTGFCPKCIEVDEEPIIKISGTRKVRF